MSRTNKICRGVIPLTWNHVSHFLPELLMPVSAKVDPARPKIDQMISTLPPNSERAENYQSSCCFYCKGYMAIFCGGNPGFCHLLNTLEPQYKLPSRSHCSEKIMPVKWKVQFISLTACIYWQNCIHEKKNWKFRMEYIFNASGYRIKLNRWQDNHKQAEPLE